MTPGLLGALLGLALVDSINPSAIAATLFLTTQPHFAVRAFVYIAAVFVAYLGVGAIALAGLGAAATMLDSTAGYVIQAIIGAGLFLYAVLAPSPKPEDADRDAWAHRRGRLSLPAVALLGVAVTLAELPTAAPYLAALALLGDSDASIPAKAGVLLVYNVIFVMPPLILAGIYLALGEQVRARFERWSAWLQRGAHTTMLWLMGIVGFHLTANALMQLSIV